MLLNGWNWQKKLLSVKGTYYMKHRVQQCSILGPLLFIIMGKNKYCSYLELWLIENQCLYCPTTCPEKLTLQACA